MTNNKLKIAYDASYAFGPKNGTTVYSQQLLKFLAKNDRYHQYIIFPFFFYHTCPNFKEFQPKLPQNFSIFLNKIPKYFTQKLWKQLLPQVDILHSTTFTIPPKKFYNKFVFTVLDTTFYTHPQFHQQANIDHCLSATKIAVKTADAIIAISNQTKKDLINYFDCPESKIYVTHLACDQEFFKTKPKENINRVLKKHKLSKPYIFHLGNLEPRKNTLGLIKAYQLLPETIRSQFDLVIAGGAGWMNNEISNYITYHNKDRRIRVLGYVEQKELPSLYQGAKCFAYPSFYEGFGIPVLEAMASKCPVLTSNISSLPEVGQNAVLYCNPYDIIDIKNKILQLLTNDNQELIKRGKLQAKKFSWDKCAKETIDIYEKLC